MIMLDRENKKPCVALDVSKGSSHVQGFLSCGAKATEVSVIQHTRSGFAQLKTIVEGLEEATNRKIAIVFECTGAYSKPIEHFLESIGWRFYEIPPLLSAKVRKSDIRPTKTDKRDCETIANVYYLKRLREHISVKPPYGKLKPLCSYYLFLVARSASDKIKYRQFLDIVYPRIDTCFNIDATYFLELIEKNPNPKKLKGKGRKSIATFFKKTPYCGEYKANKLTTLLIDYLSDAALNIPDDDASIDVLASAARMLSEDKRRAALLLEEIVLLGMKTEEYPYLVTIPGISKQSAARIAAEIGGIGRFDTPSKFVAYIGIDPSVHSSGKMLSDHLSITKKGNQRLRSLLYLVASGTSKSKAQGNPVRDFIVKKQSDGLPYRAAVIAGCNKLARIIDAVCSKRQLFSFQSQN